MVSLTRWRRKFASADHLLVGERRARLLALRRVARLEERPEDAARHGGAAIEIHHFRPDDVGTGVRTSRLRAMAVDAVARPQRPPTIVRRLIDDRRPRDLRHGGRLRRRRAAPRPAPGQHRRRGRQAGSCAPVKATAHNPTDDPDRDPLKHADTHRRSSEQCRHYLPPRALMRVIAARAEKVRRTRSGTSSRTLRLQPPRPD